MGKDQSWKVHDWFNEASKEDNVCGCQSTTFNDGKGTLEESEGSRQEGTVMDFAFESIVPG